MATTQTTETNAQLATWSPGAMTAIGNAWQLMQAIKAACDGPQTEWTVRTIRELSRDAAGPLLTALLAHPQNSPTGKWRVENFDDKTAADFPSYDTAVAYAAYSGDCQGRNCYVKDLVNNWVVWPEAAAYYAMKAARKL